MTSLPRFSVRNPVLVNLWTMAILLAGVYGGLTMVREMFPESRPNRILVTTEYPGATPREVEKGIALKIEEKIKDIKSVENIHSTITEGRSMIVVDMESGFDAIDQAVTDVKSAIDSIAEEDFPEDAKRTRVVKFDPRWPVISVALYGDLDDRALKTLGERLKNDVLALPGVTDVAMYGSRKDEISVEVQPEKLAEFHLSFMDVAQAIRASNLDLPGGQVRTPSANVAVRTLGEKDRGLELYDIVVRGDPSGRLVRLRDVAEVVDAFEDVDVVGRFNGQSSVRVTVFKTPEEDAIAIAGVVRAMIAGKMGHPLRRSWSDRFFAGLRGHDPIQKIYDRARSNPYPAEVTVQTYSDLSRFISGRLDLLKRNGFWGLILVTLSLLVFLHWRIAFWVMMGLLLAIGGSIVCMKLLGQTLNLITMFGLIIVLGMLVDDAIIVAENVYGRIERGEEPALAAVRGTEEVTWPVVCAVLTTIVAFVPLMFIQGQLGDWMGVLPVIVCIALSVSLMEALTILPSHLAHGLGSYAVGTGPSTSSSVRGWVRWRQRLRDFQHTYLQTRLRAVYERWLRKAVSYRYVTMAALGAVLIVVVGLAAGQHVPFVFLMKMDSETIVANMRMNVGSPMEATDRSIGVVEKVVEQLPELQSVFTLAGLQASVDFMPTAPQSHLAQMFIELVPIEQRDRTSVQIIQALRAKTGDIAGVERLTYTSLNGGPGGSPIHLEISGDKLDDLVAVAGEIKKRLHDFAGVFDIVDDFDAGQREARIELLDSGRALGLTTQSLATQVRAAFYGFEARKVQRGREDVRIMVRYPRRYRRRIYDVESMRIKTPAGTLVPFTEVARLTEGTGFAAIRRKNQTRTVTVKADVDDQTTNANMVIAALRRTFPSLTGRYPGVTLEFGGQKLETMKAVSSLKEDFLAAILMIYVILAGLFRSYVQPMIVMAVIPFGVIGAVFGHLLMGYPLTILSLIGLVALTGIVVNDSLVLVTFINQRIAEGAPPFEAVIDGSKSRLRAILLTSATTVLGIAPLLMETSFQAKFLIPMGISISAGLIFATVLTLVAVPSLYLIVLDAKKIGRESWSWIQGRAPSRTVSSTAS